MPPKAKLNVQSFPRPPLLEKTPRRLQVKWDDHVIADTTDGYWALETHHPPSNSPSILGFLVFVSQALFYFRIYFSLVLYLAKVYIDVRRFGLTSSKAYYLPRSAIKIPLLPSTHRSFCEWKGRASYWNLKHPTTGDLVESRVWSYDSPTEGFLVGLFYLSSFPS